MTQVDQRVLDERDQRRRAQAGDVGVGGQDDEGDEQRQVLDEATDEPSPPTPSDVSTAWMPTSCSAMYGIVARMPVTATASARPREP